MKKLLLLASLATFILSPTRLLAQCSDAGLCTYGTVHDIDKSAHGRLGIVYQIGKSPKEDSITYHTLRISEQVEFLPGSVAKLILPLNIQDGPLGTVSGFGDVMIGYEYRIKDFYQNRMLLDVGFKIASALQNVDSLPQKYQSGLGTNDIFLNVEYRADAYFLSLGYQQPLSRSTNYEHLKRGPDLVSRAGYFTTFDKLVLSGELIAIKRFGTASISYVPKPGDSEPYPEYEDVPNSDPFQLNAAVEGTYKFSQSFEMTAGTAIPFLKREFNIDGLARSITAKVGIHFNH